MDEFSLFQIVARVVVAFAAVVFAVATVVWVAQYLGHYLGHALAQRPRVVIKQKRRPPVR